MVSPLGQYDPSDPSFYRKGAIQEKVNDPKGFDKNYNAYKEEFNSPLGTMDSASYGAKKYEPPATGPHDFVNQYHIDTIKADKNLRNKDNSVTTVMARGLEVDGKIYQVPGYDREEGRILDLGEDGEIQGDTEIRRKWEPLVRQGKIPAVATAAMDTKFWYDKYLNDPAYEGINEEQLDQIIIQNHHPANVEARKNHAKNLFTNSGAGFRGVGYDTGIDNPWSAKREATVDAVANGLMPLLKAENTWNEFKEKAEGLYKTISSATPDGEGLQANRGRQNKEFRDTDVGGIKDTEIYKELPLVKGGLGSPGKMLLKELKSRVVKDFKSALGMEVKPDVITDINELFEADEIAKLQDIIESAADDITSSGTPIRELYNEEKSDAFNAAVKKNAELGKTMDQDDFPRQGLSWNPEKNKKFLPKNKMTGFTNQIITGDAAQVPKQQLRYTLGTFTVSDKGDYWELYDVYDFSRFSSSQDKGIEEGQGEREALSAVKSLWTEWKNIKDGVKSGNTYYALRSAMAVVLSDTYGNATQMRIKIPKRKIPNIGAMPAK